MLLQTSPTPFFSNDPAGLFRVFVAFVIGMSPGTLLVAYFLKKGPKEEIALVKRDLTNLGAKVDDMGKSIERDRAEVSAMRKDIAENQQEIIQMLSASAAAIQQGVSALSISVARLEERSDIAECFDKFGSKIENALIRAAQPK